MKCLFIYTFFIFFANFNCNAASNFKNKTNLSETKKVQLRLNLKKGKVYNYNIKFGISSQKENKKTPMLSFDMPLKLTVAKVEGKLASIDVESNSILSKSSSVKQIQIDEKGQIKSGKGSSPIPVIWPENEVKIGDSWIIKAVSLGAIQRLIGTEAIQAVCTLKAIEQKGNGRIAEIHLKLQEEVKKAKLGEGKMLVDLEDGMLTSMNVSCLASGNVLGGPGRQAEICVTRGS